MSRTELHHRSGREVRSGTRRAGRTVTAVISLAALGVAVVGDRHFSAQTSSEGSSSTATSVVPEANASNAAPDDGVGVAEPRALHIGLGSGVVPGTEETTLVEGSAVDLLDIHFGKPDARPSASTSIGPALSGDPPSNQDAIQSEAARILSGVGSTSQSPVVVGREPIQRQILAEGESAIGATNTGQQVSVNAGGKPEPEERGLIDSSDVVSGNPAKVAVQGSESPLNPLDVH